MTRLCAEPAVASFFESFSATPSPVYGTPRLVLLNHLHRHFGDIQGIQAHSDKLGPILRLGCTHPHVLDASLAIAASHLRYSQELHLDRHAPHANELIKSSRVAEYFQQSLAIRNYHQALRLPFDQKGSDALLITCMMLNLLTFSMDVSDEPLQCWVFSDAPDRLNWFSINMGLKTLLLRTEEYRDNSLLQALFTASDDKNGTFHGEGQKPLVDVPEHWKRLCGLSEDSHMDDVFYEPIRVLAVVRKLPVSQESSFLYTSFFGKLDFEFRDLLAARDERATWMLAYWFGLLCRFVGIWWFHGKALNDYRGMYLWLERAGVRDRVGKDGEMWKALMADLKNAPIPPSSVDAIDWDNLDL